jgi:copper(I)-binding protein
MRIITSVVALCLTIAQAAVADAPELLTTSISVSDVSASAGRPGGTSRLRLTLTNDGTDSVTFLGVESNVAERSQLVGRVGAVEDHVFGSFSIPPEATLELNTSHLWLSLRTLHRPLVAGDSFPMTLMFSRGELPVTVHVHP